MKKEKDMAIQKVTELAEEEMENIRRQDEEIREEAVQEQILQGHESLECALLMYEDKYMHYHNHCEKVIAGIKNDHKNKITRSNDKITE